MNRYPMWVNLLVLGVLLGGMLLALPSFYGDDPAVHVSTDDGTPIEEPALAEFTSALEKADITPAEAEIEDGAALIRFTDVADQLRASDMLRGAFPENVVALTLAPRTPEWLQALGLRPMALGLDLRGGVHFLYQVDLESALEQFLASYEADLRTQLREANIRNQVRVVDDALLVEVLESGDLERAEEIVRGLNDDPTQLTDRLLVERTQIDGQPGLRVELSETAIQEREDFAVQQNTITLRNRVDELGVSEPVVQRQGRDRILVELPGIQDPSQAERVLGATATLEFRLVDTEANAQDAQRRGRAPLGSELHFDRSGAPVVLRREAIVRGDQLTDATSQYSEGQPAVSVRLDAQGGRRMLQTTQANLNRPMAVLMIEENPEFVTRNGEQVIETTTEETVINVATIRGVFSNNFQITGLTPFEATDLALLLRSGALATPIFKIEERTIGPSLGQDNIERGREAVLVGFLLVVVFMLLIYRMFGVIANIALLANLILLVALMSLLQAALTLPGIAGIVLTLGMAVDANVLINERIREELKNGNSPQASIRAGYEKAFSSIADGNITTLIAGIVLFAFGTGPIKGFAVTLSLGIVTSMFTAIVATRVLVNLIYGRRAQIKRLPIGIRVSDATV